MRKKQKIKSKKQSQRSFRAFISIVNWYKNKFDIALYISNIYGNEYQKKEVNIHKLPMWRDITQVQKLAYFFYFMAETKKFTNIKPFTLDLSKQFRDKYSNLTYKKLKAVIIKRIYGNLDYIFKSSDKPMMSFILENKHKNKRKDINDKETHIHGIREVFDEEIDDKIQQALKTSVCNGIKNIKAPNTTICSKLKKDMIKMVQTVGYVILIKERVPIMVCIYLNLFLKKYVMTTTNFIRNIKKTSKS